jgi:hypothetical protein
MPRLVRPTCLVVAIAIATPVLAQEGRAARIEIAKLSKRLKPHAPAASEAPGSSSVTWECGAYFRCYSGVPLQCSEQTRPYQNIAAHRCFCIHAGCPQ